MAKRVIRLNKSGAVSPAPSREPRLKGPRKPVRLGQEAPVDTAELSRTQPMKRIVVGGAAAKRRLAGGSTSPGSRTTGAANNQQQKRKPAKKAGGPPLWLIPVGIMAVIILIVIIVSASSNRKQDPYFAGGPVVNQNQRDTYKRNQGPRPMKEWMEQHGETDMAKARKARMNNRGTITRTNSSD